MTVRGADGEREIPAEDFFLGVYMTAVGPGELLTKITLPAGSRDGFDAVTIGKEGTCIASAAASLDAPDGTRVVLGCVDATPVRATQLESRLNGDLSEPAAREAARGVAANLNHRPTSTPRRTTAAISPRSAPPERSPARRRERGSPVSTQREAPSASRAVSVEVDGERFEREVEARKLLVHFLRDDLDKTGTHIGCDTGNCGACSVLVDGELVKSCMVLAVQADGASIETVEGLAQGDELAPLQQAFSSRHALQCGYCTPGMLMSATYLLAQQPRADRARDPPGAAGEHLPLHRLLEHLRGDRRRGKGDVAPPQEGVDA